MTLLPAGFFDNYWTENYSLPYSGYIFRTSHDEKSFSIEGTLPGIAKGDVDLSYDSVNKTFHIFVKDKIDKYVPSPIPIDEKNIEAELSLGILKVKAPILKSSKSIQIK